MQLMRLTDSSELAVDDTGGPGPVLLWFGGSPSTGVVLAPLREAAAAHGLRVVCWPRPGYAGRPRAVGRRVADVAEDAAAVLDHLGVDSALAVGYSGGGPHALAAAALLGGRITGVGVLAGPAPYPLGAAGTAGAWWFDGMASPGALRAAAEGRQAREEHARHEEFDPSQFTDTDWETLKGPWGAVGDDAQAASAASSGTPDGLVDDDVALTTGWGVDLAAVRVPVALVHGRADRVVPPSHSEALAGHLPQVRRLPCARDAGHVAVLLALPSVLSALPRRPAP